MSQFIIVIRSKKLRVFTVLSFLLFSCQFLYAQDQIRLSILERSDNPKTELEHDYLLEIKNLTSTKKNIIVKAQNVTCNAQTLTETSLTLQLLDPVARPTENVGSGDTANLIPGYSVVLGPGQSKEVVLRTTRNANTQLDAWSCTEVYAEMGGSRLNNKSVVIKQLVPNPNTFE